MGSCFEFSEDQFGHPVGRRGKGGDERFIQLVARGEESGGGHDGRVVMAELFILGGSMKRGGVVGATGSVSSLLPRKYIVINGEGDTQNYRINVLPTHKLRPCRGDVCRHSRALLSYLRASPVGGVLGRLP